MALSTLKSELKVGTFITKEAPPDIKEGEAIAARLLKEMGDIASALEVTTKKQDQQFTDLNNHYKGVKGDSDQLKAQVLEQTKTYADLTVKVQTLTQALDQVKRELDVPIVNGGKALAENDTKAAVELQRRAFLFKGGDEEQFKPDMANLVKASDYREAVRMLMKTGIDSRDMIIRRMPEQVRKAFEAGSLDSAMFSPEMLGIEINCIVECAELLDLYNSVSVSKSQFMYPQVLDYGNIGKYDCDAKCDAEYGPEGNITYKSGNVKDWRGVFCFNRKVLAEANYDLLNFMYNAAARSHRINYNRALMQGDGNTEPQGWMTANCFPSLKTATNHPTHVEFRQFYSAIPMEYGPVTAIMHQNVFAYFATMTDSIGRFLIGDGLLTYGPTDVRERIRISNCLPDATHGLTLGSAANPMITGEFLCAVGAWKQAYYAVSKRSLWIEQWIGKSTAWCVAYSFGAEDGGFVGCCPAARILRVGP